MLLSKNKKIMALITCEECGKEISSKAAACVYCGNPMVEEKRRAPESTPPLSTHPLITPLNQSRKDPMLKVAVNSELDKYRTNHLLHLMLSVLTASIWGIVWIAISAGNVLERNKIRTKNKMALEGNPALYLLMIAFSMILFAVFYINNN